MVLMDTRIWTLRLSMVGKSTGSSGRILIMGTDPTSEESTLLRRAVAGDARAFAGIVERYGARITRFCASRLGSAEEGRDAAQDVFLRAYSSLKSFRLGESFAAWLFAIAANRTRTLYRSRELERRREAAAIAASQASSQDPVAEAEQDLLGEALRRLVSHLTDDLRAVIELYYFAGLSVSETASVLGLGEEAVKSRLFRARRNLRESLADLQPTRGSEGMTP